jgi:hypothetical protein
MVMSTESCANVSELLTDAAELRAEVEIVVNSTPVVDAHTHLFPPEFNQLSLFGIDELLTYHYLTAEMFRSARIGYDPFWAMSKQQQADLVWKTLFVDNTPASEATQGIISVLDAFGLDTRAPDLSEARAFFDSQRLPEHIDHVFDIARVSGLVMTNDPLDQSEAQIWKTLATADERFKTSLRLDRLVNNWEGAIRSLSRQGVFVTWELQPADVIAIRGWLDQWIQRMSPLYMAVSLPADFQFPGDDIREQLLREVVLPAAKEHGLTLTAMVGVRRAVNPNLREAGDAVGQADVTAIERLCAEYPDVRFMATFLSRENQHQLCVAARKFNNLMPFGCWWFLNNPSIVSEITRERLELLGHSFIPQHSDARVLEQLIYKWKHARRQIADALCISYEQLLQNGRAVTREEISRDVTRLFSGNFNHWVSAA